MSLFKKRKKPKIRYDKGKTVQDIMVCRLKGHIIGKRWKWNWHKGIFGGRRRGNRIETVYCVTCIIDKLMIKKAKL